MQNQLSEIFDYSSESLLAVAEHDPWLVALSVSIAIFASFMGFQVASQAAVSSSNRRKHASLLVGSFALGGGVWSMHFIGMLALELCTKVSYQVDITIISMLPAIIASWVALSLITREKIKITQLILGGVLVGAGIGTMHYVGMAAMQMAPLLRYDLWMFSTSIVVAVVLAILSLWIRFALNTIGNIRLSYRVKTFISSCVMGSAISGMHYTGMAAARFVLPPGVELSKQTNDISFYLALGITVITVVIIGLVVAVNLVFRHKDISAAATQNEKRLSAIMDTTVDGIITIDEVGNIIGINTAVTRMLGWEEGDLINNNINRVVPEPFQSHDTKFTKADLQAYIAEITVRGREIEAITNHGEKIPVRLEIGCVELNEQQMFVAFISDLRERLRMEAALRNNEARIRSLLTNIPGIAYRCIDTTGWPNIYINDEVENIIGYPASDFLLPDPKRSLADFVHPDDFSLIEATDLRNPDGFKMEFRFIDRYGKVKWVLGHGRALKKEGCEDYYLDGFIMDISDRKQMESEVLAAKDKAERAAETRSAFLANMSHEIRTPMNAVIGFSDILLDEELKPNQRKHLNIINQSAKSLLHILNDVLDSAKLEKGKFQLEYRDFSLVEEVDAVVSTLWLQAQNKGLTLDLNIHTAAQGYFNGAPDRIRQVLTNLLGNAIKFTEQGKITIEITSVESTTVAKPAIQFTIKDTGIGITASQLATIFDAFSQADESMSRRFGGTGLGTTISKQLVELMQGEIFAKSTEGVGSEFSFIIPLTPIEYSRKVTTEKNQQTLPKLHILVVDDIDQNIDLLTLLLKRNGHKISEARDGEQALLQIQNNPVDVVLMDIQMPVMDGLTAAKQRRKYERDHELKRVPIIALTASVLPQDRLSAEQAGMDGFANKPIDMDHLNAEIASVLKLEHTVVDEVKNVDKSTLKIDIDKGAKLWGSKTNLYVEIDRFIKHSEVELPLFKQLFEQSKAKELGQLAHKFKGSAGNLALNRLMKMLDELEGSCKEEDALKLTKCQLIIENIEAEFCCIKNCVSKMSDGEEEASEAETSSQSSVTDAIDILGQLEQSVSNNEFDDELLDKLQSLAPLRPNEINAIVNACNDFEFSQATELIIVLIAQLQAEQVNK
ncbi:PAS domain S-box protein [Colwellia sp. D2M02]|uniref:MHYT domain-containing protein n=1 Tax=Colwellia sp. D2M02 TaxID=2841562 RepID=UPI001C083DE5|nr:MHYT domain-containing protein [Colwellia sp. D2M02]MBU2892257.1 PAS domain S-box protein [Colwellia sp. D2M02]